jgi:hypothetical protein
MAKKKNSRKRDAERRRLAASAARREQHAKLVVDRQGDTRFVQRARTSMGRTLTWDANSEQGTELKEAMLQQRAAFVQKFGREPGANDPIFFDPNMDEPMPYGPEAEAEMWEEMFAVAEDAGLDQAHIHAWREVGYVVTESNQHLFSAMDVEAYLDAVGRHMGEPVEDEDVETADESLLVELADDTAHCLEVLVGRTLLGGGDDQPALRFVESLVDALDDDDEDDGSLVALVFGCLLGWLVGAKESGIAGAAAVNWVNAHLSETAAGAAVRVSGLVGYPFAPALTVDEMNDELGSLAIAAMTWLAAGVVSTAGGDDANWLRQFDSF